ncbi:hypothetical protein TSUD_345630 [Trifolium subterraneum]|nr:hypothetical protein TSUD_345630 [Trifolium subterraneum]
MGGCYSDMKAKEAVGGVNQKATNNNNDAVDFFYTSQGFQPLFTQVELSFSAYNLLDLDVASKSDPMLVVYAKKVDGKFEELGRTEIITNCLNPEWIEKINIAFHFEIVQPLVFHVYDIDTTYHGVSTKTIKLKDQDFIGEAMCNLSEIVTKQSRSLTLKLQSKNGNNGQNNIGTITIRAEETVASRSAVEIMFSCSHLDNKDTFSKSDPFLRISRMVESGGTIPICKTEVIDNNLNPKWKQVSLNFQQFGSKETPLVIECFDFNRNGNHVLIGFKILTSKFVAIRKMQKSIADLEKLCHERKGANFVVPSKRKGQEKVLKGQLFVDHYNEKEQFSFIDYISSGFELNFMVAIDFTASNGDPQKSDSLHYIDGSGRLNSYQQILDADNARLINSTGRVAARDMVQFVPMREVKKGQISVVQSLLEELPDQFLSFMRSRDIKPLFSHPTAPKMQ